MPYYSDDVIWDISYGRKNSQLSLYSPKSQSIAINGENMKEKKKPLWSKKLVKVNLI